MTQYCLTAREAAEQFDLSLVALMALVEQHADVAVNVNDAWRVDPVRLAEITGDTAWRLLPRWPDSVPTWRRA